MEGVGRQEGVEGNEIIDTPSSPTAGDYVQSKASITWSLPTESPAHEVCYRGAVISWLVRLYV